MIDKPRMKQPLDAQSSCNRLALSPINLFFLVLPVESLVPLTLFLDNYQKVDKPPSSFPIVFAVLYRVCRVQLLKIFWQLLAPVPLAVKPNLNTKLGERAFHLGRR